MKGLTWRISVVVFSVLFALYLLIPSFLKFKMGQEVGKTVRPEDPWYHHILPTETFKLGLDLSGGLHLVLGIDFNEVEKDAILKMKSQLKDLLEKDKITGVELSTTNDNKLHVAYTDEAAWKATDAAIAKELGQYLDFVGQSGKTATLQLSTMYGAEVRKRAIDQSIETLRNRIDEFGIAEPIIQRQGEEKILVQFPGVQEPGRLKEIISRTAKLSFQIVVAGPEVPDGPPNLAQLDTWVKEYKDAKKPKLDATTPISKYGKEINDFLASKLPSGTELLFHKNVNVNTREAEYIPYLLKKEALVTGEDLQDAYYGFDQQNNQPIVNFQLTPVGAGKFEKATGENIHKYMAIVLDNNVHSAPFIKTKIGGGRALIEMGKSGKASNDVLNDAKDTSLVLRSGALPARLEFLEERVVGPSLGADAIRSGTISLVAGLGLVFLFMLVYYRASGMVANFALLFNGILILSAMAAFEGTLTLPGLAGILLTLGMAVDANVLIFEHVREELRAGKNMQLALSEGYTRALSAIIDAHVTTIIAAIVLLSFGYGAIRGFAVTMLIGLSASLYTAVFVTRVVFDYLFVARNWKSISV